MKSLSISPQMKKMLIIVGIIFGVIFSWYGLKKVMFFWYMARFQPPAVTVSASTATVTNWQSFLSSVGTLTAVNGVDVSSEASGIVRELHFNSGQFVHEGDLLVKLDTSVEEAQLKNDQAKLKLAETNFSRSKTLVQKKVLAQAVLDESEAQLKEAEANLEEAQAKINQKTIKAPFNGRIGIRQIDIGEYVSAGKSMVTLQSLDPLYVRFNLPEQYLPQLFINQLVDADVNLDTGIANVPGTLTAINAKVDQTTRNVLIEATIPNKKLTLYPGMFASVRVWLKQQQNVITLPQTAISYSLHGDSVFLIKPQDKSKHPVLKVYRQYVEVGERRGKLVIIKKGVKAGDQVVTSGQLKLQNGTNVVIDNSVEL